MNEEQRNPDVILRKLEEEERQKYRGKLKIFFGYAAGVGKTYAMLEAAHVAKEAGTDVVAGYIEPHTRPETMMRVDGLEVLPPLQMNYRNIELKEFVLDGALIRKPQLVLVDELAHTNGEGCRHLKRYQDIEEVLKSGIDVYTTVNVQHIESLNDVVASLTGVVVKERIPDFVFDGASQVELVDLEPVELLERLKLGKIYKEKQAGRAMQNFFTEDNLIALREVALRRMADRVNLIQEKLSTAEHLLICLSPSPSNEKVIRRAARMAKAFHGKFTAFFVETSAFSDFSKEDMERLRCHTRLAEQLGAKTVTSYGDDIVEQIAEYAKAAKVTKVVLGRTYTKRSRFGVMESFSEKLTKLAPQIEIFVIPDCYEKEYVNKRKKKWKYETNYILKDILVSCVVLGASTAISYLFAYWGFSEANLIMVYLLGVMVTSLFTKHRLCSTLASVLSVLVFNYCFTEPIKTFSVYDPGYIATFVIMFIMAFVSTTLMQKIKQHAKQAVMKSYRTEILLETSQKFQKAADGEAIAAYTAQQLSELLEKNILFYFGNPDTHPEPIEWRSVQEREMTPYDQAELGVASWVYKNNKHAGFSTSTLPGVKYLYLAVRSGEKVFGVVGIDMKGKPMQTFEQGLMGAILNECALALEKEMLIKERKESAIQLQKEQLRANLLRSISHDLRTPLTSISGNAGVLISNGDEINELKKQQLYVDIYEDAMWLINLVENLLSVTRIENGTMALSLQGELVDEVITEALGHLRKKKEDHEIVVHQENDLFMAKMDTKLIIQVFINLIDNAIKYTPPGTTIQIRTKKRKDMIVIEVIDNGQGIKDEEKTKLFDMFFTMGQSVADGRRGMGLGLALCKSIIEAHGGEISVHDNKPRGTIFRFTLKAEEVHLDEG
ncbi:MAG: sensor histidine kinase KdpD [Niameybacter sp.]